jgi:TRAP transporter TAXI family solute receptor
MKPCSRRHWVMLMVFSSLLFVSQLGAEGIGMVTGSSTGIYIQFGQDIAKVAQSVGLDILVKESEGSIDNIRRLVSTENAALGIVQSDVLGFLTRSTDPQVRRIASRLRLIFPFYNEEVHLLARTDIRRFEDLNGRRMVVGTQASGNWVTSSNLLRMVNVNPAELIELPPPEGVSAVLTGQADAMLYVVGKPAKLFTAVLELQKDPRFGHLTKDIHFVPLTHPAILQEYLASTIGPNDYPWSNETVSTVAVKAVLISFDFSSRKNAYYQQRCGDLGKLGGAIRENFAELQRTGHPKWREVDLGQEVGIWKRDACSQMATRVPQQAPQTADDLLKAIVDILKGKGQPR